MSALLWTVSSLVQRMPERQHRSCLSEHHIDLAGTQVLMLQ